MRRVLDVYNELSKNGSALEFYQFSDEVKLDLAKLVEEFCNDFGYLGLIQYVVLDYVNDDFIHYIDEDGGFQKYHEAFNNFYRSMRFKNPFYLNHASRIKYYNNIHNLNLEEWINIFFPEESRFIEICNGIV